MSEKDKITPESLYKARRIFLKGSIYSLTGLATAGIYRFFRHSQAADGDLATPLKKSLGSESATSFNSITHYNNYYEFSTDKEAVADKAKNWKISDWTLKVEGLVEKPFSLNLNDIKSIPTEERIYRHRCVEGWSMVIPWIGFPLARLLEQAKVSPKATHVAFESFYDEHEMPSAKFAGIKFPYVEGLRLDEALHPLCILATGLYDKALPSQNGPPLRLVVPWKYGFKSAKSIVKITVTDREPPTTWNIANPSEYGFYSNVNPAVDHPRWSQKTERRIGELALRKTLPFNGYASEVEHLYKNMDLRVNF